MKARDTTALFYFILSYWAWKKDEGSMLPEILYHLGMEKMVKFFKIFGGQTVKIPTMKDLSSELKEAIAAYLVISEGCSLEYVQQHLEIDGRVFRKMKSRIVEWEKYLKTVEFRRNDVEEDC